MRNFPKESLISGQPLPFQDQIKREGRWVPQNILVKVVYRLDREISILGVIPDRKILQLGSRRFDTCYFVSNVIG